MTAVNENKYRKIFKIGINFIVPIILLIYLLTTFINISLFNAELGKDAIRYRIATYSSIGITVLIILLYFVSRVYSKVSSKRKSTVFIISLLTLTEGIIWADLSLIEIFLESIGSILVDLTPLFVGLIIVLSFNLFIKGIGLFIVTKEDKRKQDG